MTVVMRMGINISSLNELHRLHIDRNLVETHITRSNIQNNVIQDEIIRNEKENSYNLQAHARFLTNSHKILRDTECNIGAYRITQRRFVIELKAAKRT
jgi:hypothetical protein